MGAGLALSPLIKGVAIGFFTTKIATYHEASNAGFLDFALAAVGSDFQGLEDEWKRFIVFRSSADRHFHGHFQVRHALQAAAVASLSSFAFAIQSAR